MSYRKSQFPYFSFRTTKDTLTKIRNLAIIHGRSVNKEIEQILLLHISSWNEGSSTSDEDDIFLTTVSPPARTAIRIAPETLNTIKYIAECNGRSTNKEIEQIILRYIRNWESKHGTVPLDS